MKVCIWQLHDMRADASRRSMVAMIAMYLESVPVATVVTCEGNEQMDGCM